MGSSRFDATTRYMMTAVLLAAPALPAVASADSLLASYEYSEVGCLVVTSPDGGMTMTWPLCGGTGVPPATDGDCVLKMGWIGETDRKVEIKHEWTDCMTFDLPGIVAGVAELQVDVYIAAPSAVPQIVGIWDDILGWIEGWPVPTPTDEWIPVSMYVGDLRDAGHDPYTGLDHIYALVFDNLTEDYGTIYVDNLRLTSATQLTFAERNWSVKHAAHVGPGWNYFSARPEIVWVDDDGLHLKVAQRDGLWLCSEVVCNDSLGYGSYVYTVQDCVDLLDQNIVLGLFTWDTYADPNLPGQDREIDFEFGKWGDPNNDNAQYVIQPWDAPGNMHRFDIDCSGPTEMTTHVMTWRSDAIHFTSYYGDFSLAPPAENVIESWSYSGSDIPPPGGETVRMNLWLADPNGPANGQDAEAVISDFRHFSSLLAAFAECMDGPDVSHPPGCEYADTDGDGDVDLADCAAFQQAFDG